MESKIDLLPIYELPKDIAVMESVFDIYGYGDDTFAIIENGFFIGVIEGDWLEYDEDEEWTEEYVDTKTYQLEYIDIMNSSDRRRGVGTRAFQLLKEKYGATHIVGEVEPYDSFPHLGGFRELIKKFGASIVETFDDDNMGSIWAGEGTFDDYIESYFEIRL